MIFRKEATDLQDSTIKDFKELTGKKLDSHRNVNYPNGSVIMFRHVEEINPNILQNVNLDWFFIEQAEELTTDETFFLLWGRFKRKMEPTEAFVKLGLPMHSGWICANVKGRNWVRALWKDDPNAKARGFDLIEATTMDNIDNLSEDYLQRIELLKKMKPDMYKRFCENDWDVEVEGRAITPELIETCIGGELSDPVPHEEYVLGSDFAKRQDWWVIVVANKRTGQVVYFDRFQKESWALMRGKTVAVAKRYNNAEVIPDSTGVGDPITEDLQTAGCRVYSEGDRPGFVFSSRTKEQLIENLIVTMTNRGITYPRSLTIMIDELKEFEKTESKAGNIRYSAPDGKHDDCVIGLALACWGLRSPRVIGNPSTVGQKRDMTTLKDF